jgi:hypothetical protein
MAESTQPKKLKRDFFARMSYAYLVIVAAGFITTKAARTWAQRQQSGNILSFALGIIFVTVVFALVYLYPSWARFVRENWPRYIAMFVFGLTLGVLGHYGGAGIAPEQILYEMAGGVFSLLLFQVIADYKNIKFLSEMLDDHQLSFHVGARLYESHSHNDVINRERPIKDLIRGRDVIRLLTGPSDGLVVEDYLRPGHKEHQALREKLDGGSKLHILMFTPIYNLRGYVDKAVHDGSEDGFPETQTQPPPPTHMPSVDFAHEQQHNIIQHQIEPLQRDFPRQVVTRFFYISHHISMIICGNKKIFSSPLLLGTQGPDLPCLVVFPTLASEVTLFEKVMNEFKYLWDKPKLYFTLEEMKNIYTYAEGVISANGGKLTGQISADIEDYAEGLLQHRVDYLKQVEDERTDRKKINVEECAKQALAKFVAARTVVPSAAKPSAAETVPIRTVPNEVV